MSRNKPLRNTRKFYLNELCKQIYGTAKVNYDEKYLAITKNSGLTDKPISIFKTPESMAGYKVRMIRLFELTFSCEDINFEFDMNRDIAIKNALDYFKKHDIDLQSILPSQMSIIQAILIGLCDYILAAIFGVPSTLTNPDDDSSQENNSNYSSEIIDEKYHNQLIAFKSRLLLQSSFSSPSIDIDDQECYYNPSYFKERDYKEGKRFSQCLGECNFAIPFTIQEVLEFPYIFPISINIPIDKVVKEKTKEECFSDLVRGYHPIDNTHHIISEYVSTDQADVDPYSAKALEFNLSEINFIDGTEMKTIYYLTCINQLLIDELYDNPSSHADLHDRILRKARSHIHGQTKKYIDIAVKKSRSILDYVENILKRFNDLITYDEYIQGSVPDEQTGKSILGIFEIKDNEVIEKIIGDGHDPTKWKSVYICIDEAFNKFSDFISYKTQRKKKDNTFDTVDNETIKETILCIRQYISKKEISYHIERITDIITSPKSDKAIDEKKKYIDTAELVSPYGSIYKRIPNLGERIKAAMQSYIEGVNYNLTNRTLNEFLSSCPEKNEKDFSDAQEDKSQAPE